MQLTKVYFSLLIFFSVVVTKKQTTAHGYMATVLPLSQRPAHANILKSTSEANYKLIKTEVFKSPDLENKTNKQTKTSYYFNLK